MADDPCMIADPKEVCADGFKLAASRYRCDVCQKAKPKHLVTLPGIPRTLEVCDRCKEAQAVPLWYPVAQAAMAGGYANMNNEGRMMVRVALNFHNVNFSDFLEMVNDDIAILPDEATIQRMKKKATDQEIPGHPGLHVIAGSPFPYMHTKGRA